VEQKGKKKIRLTRRKRKMRKGKEERRKDKNKIFENHSINWSLPGYQLYW
jgi:hypothetical protein